MAIVSMIGAPTDIGASARGASMGPEALRVAGLRDTLQAQGLEVHDCGNLRGPHNPGRPPVDGYRHLKEVTEWNQLVHDAVHAELQAGHLPILLGGDHSLAIGSISAVARHCRARRQAAARAVARRTRRLQHPPADAEWQRARHAGRLPVRLRPR